MYEFCPHQSAYGLWEVESRGGRRASKFTSSKDFREQEGLWPKRHPFRRFGQHWYECENFPEVIKDHYKEQWYSNSQLYRMQVDKEHGGSLAELISVLPGPVYLSVTNCCEELPLTYCG